MQHFSLHRDHSAKSQSPGEVWWGQPALGDREGDRDAPSTACLTRAQGWNHCQKAAENQSREKRCFSCQGNDLPSSQTAHGKTVSKKKLRVGMAPGRRITQELAMPPTPTHPPAPPRFFLGKRRDLDSPDPRRAGQSPGFPPLTCHTTSLS